MKYYYKIHLSKLNHINFMCYVTLEFEKTEEKNVTSMPKALHSE